MHHDAVSNPSSPFRAVTSFTAWIAPGRAIQGFHSSGKHIDVRTNAVRTLCIACKVRYRVCTLFMNSAFY